MFTTTTRELLIQTEALKKTALSFRAINHELRRQIMQLIHKNGRMTVTKVYKELNMEQSVASQHLAILRREGIVKTEKQHRFVFYSINYQRIKEIEAVAGELLKKPEQRTIVQHQPKTELRMTTTIIREDGLVAAVKRVLE